MSAQNEYFYWLVYFVSKYDRRNLEDKYDSLNYSLEGLKERYERKHVQTSRHCAPFSHYEIYRHGDGQDAPPVYRTGEGQ